MSGKRIFIILAFFGFSIVFILILYFVSDNIKKSKNGFIRLFPPHAITSQKELDLKFNSYYIAGVTSHNLFLGCLTAPVILRSSSLNLADTQTFRIMLPPIKTSSPESFRITIDSPYLYVIDRLTASVYSGEISDSCRFVGKLDKVPFIDGIPLSRSSFIYRTYKSSLDQNILVKTKLPNIPITKTIFLLDKYKEGLFSTDGMLINNKRKNNLVFVYFYFNQFAVIDSNLTLIYKGKTIDTVSIPKIKVAEIISEKTKTMAAPPVMVNKKSAVYGTWLYINSGLAANNESYQIFSKHSVIDVYSLLDGRYRESFYLPEYNHEKCADFKVYDNKLVAIYGHLLVIFTLNLNVK